MLEVPEKRIPILLEASSRKASLFDGLNRRVTATQKFKNSQEQQSEKESKKKKKSQKEVVGEGRAAREMTFLWYDGMGTSACNLSIVETKTGQSYRSLPT